MAERRAIHAVVTTRAHTAWHDTAALNGISTSALVQAHGDQYAEDLDQDLDLDPGLVDAARQIDADNRKRTR